ncbi:DUF5916 domain-containing protein [Pleionea sp. CnH1-48]|uniref:DUF5916 domain-containing protein n=1 Tax=Pleionea sp. CnH1-48 TaxID=2954494 RepID=UPI0020985B31|nr:DUF5916 domain-containing protein [Pleionea sp. CnH1-48]MCO7227477.1 DUF5916 domain-containing protein [Pleionea sp. CnH1-48]
MLVKTIDSVKNCLTLIRNRLFVFTVFATAALPGHTMIVDGKLDEAEWQNAQVFTEFVQSFPNTGQSPKMATKTLLLTRKEGIYVAFVNQQPFAARSRRYSGHDQYTSADFNMVFIDFNGDGNTAYEFVATLGGGTMDGTYSRGNNSNRDWDGPWTSAVSEDENNWYSEFFIPWSIATYKSQSAEANNQRNIRVYFQRNNVFASEAYSFPDTNRGRPNFTYEYAPVSIDFQSAQSISANGYLATEHDRTKSSQQWDAGLDFIWKPNAAQQFIATINPDFGQVESDELIVNFSTIETLRTDKRPFFTENQSLFDIRGPENLRLFNTRRIGGLSDGGSGQIHDVDLALKSLTAFEFTDLGIFFAQEDDLPDSEGKTFLSARWLHSKDQTNFGQLINWVNNPTLDREAITTNFDINHTFSPQTKLFANIIGSKISQPNNSQTDATSNNTGLGATISASYRPQRTFENLFELSYFDENLELNDLGYLARNNLWLTRLTSKYNDYRFTPQSLLRRLYYQGKLTYSNNTQGETLPWSAEFTSALQLKSKDFFLVSLNYQNEGTDDLISRGHGSVQLPSRKKIRLRYASPSPADFSYSVDAYYYQEGVSEYAKKWIFDSKIYFSDTFRLDATYTYIDSDDWLLGNSDGELNQYHRRFNKLNTKWVAKINQHSDIAATFQWYGLKSKGQQTFAVGASGELQATNAAPDNFIHSQSALQLRYRYRFAPLSDFYLVYLRNRFISEQDLSLSFSDLFHSTEPNPDEDRLVAKIRYQF